VVAATLYVSLASLSAALALAAARLLGAPTPFADRERILTGFSLLAAALVAARHRANIARLYRGQESRLTDSPRLRLFARTLHVLALGLWFGAGLFFTFGVAPSLFHTFEGYAGAKPDWLPAADGLTKEQGTRLAGAAVGPLFPLYFALQGVCGVVALATAWGWMKTAPADRLVRSRFAVLAMAVALVVAGWPLVGKVEDLRFARYSADESVSAPARDAFGRWHTVSLLMNFGTLGLVTVGMGMAARLPDEPLPSQ
jgi:hypothetical protein